MAFNGDRRGPRQGGFNRGGGNRFGGGRSFGGNRGGGFRRFNDGPRQMHKITCAECGKEDEVPFKPRDNSTVLCKECYMKSKGITPRARPEGKSADAGEEADSVDSDEADLDADVVESDEDTEDFGEEEDK